MLRRSGVARASDTILAARREWPPSSSKKSSVTEMAVWPSAPRQASSRAASVAVAGGSSSRASTSIRRGRSSALRLTLPEIRVGSDLRTS